MQFWSEIILEISRTKLHSPFPPCKEIQDSLGFWIPPHGFRISGTRFRSVLVGLGFWISIVSGIPDSLSCIPDSRAQDSGFYWQNFPDSGFQKQHFIGFQSGFPNVGRQLSSIAIIYLLTSSAWAIIGPNFIWSKKTTWKSRLGSKAHEFVIGSARATDFQIFHI